MKEHVHQLRSKLKFNKKGNFFISEYVLSVRAIIDSQLVIGDHITERNLINAILQGLPEE